MNPRRRLPNRRRHEVIEFVHESFRYVAGISRFDDGTLGEVFLNSSAKSGTQVESASRDAAVVMSIALQHNTPLITIQNALSRTERGEAAGPVGKLLDILAAEDAT